MPEIRHLQTIEEKQALTKIGSIAFNFPLDLAKPETSEFDTPVDWRWGYYEGGKLRAGMMIHPFKMRFDGNTVSMAGVGGVATLPEERRGGKIRQIFSEVFAEEYEKGTEFSMLAPFSHSFYRQFGFEVLSSRKETTIQHKCFQKPTDGSFEQFEPGGATGVLEDIHTAYIEKLNLAIPRVHRPDNLAWRAFVKDDPYKDRYFIYIWRDGAGNARSYVAFRREGNDPDKVRLNIREVAYKDPEALRRVFDIFYMMRIKEIHWPAPMRMPVYDLFPEHWSIEEKLNPVDMGRVVHLERTLTQMRRPAGEGAYVVEAHDPQIKANNGKFLVEYGPEGARVSRTQKDADLTCRIPVLSQLIAGYRTLDDALFLRDDIELHGNAETLRNVFTIRPTHLTENF